MACKSATNRQRHETGGDHRQLGSAKGSTEKGGKGDIQMEIENENGKATEFATSLL